MEQIDGGEDEIKTVGREQEEEKRMVEHDGGALKEHSCSLTVVVAQRTREAIKAVSALKKQLT